LEEVIFMKIKEGFMLREVADTWIVVPLAQRVVEFNGLMTLTESGASLWSKLQSGSDVEGLVQYILSEYSVDEEVARQDVKEFIDSISERGLFE
jgi:hypothetical protein